MREKLFKRVLFVWILLLCFLSAGLAWSLSKKQVHIQVGRCYMVIGESSIGRPGERIKIIEWKIEEGYATFSYCTSPETTNTLPVSMMQEGIAEISCDECN